MKKSNITAWIEDAMKGGWVPEGDSRLFLKESLRKKPKGKKPKGHIAYFYSEHRGNVNIAIERILLDPNAWQAVGKTRGWDKPENYKNSMYNRVYIYYWHQFINHLAEGKDIESSLGEISK